VGLVALALLVAALGAVIVMASLRNDRQSAVRERQALLASLRAHETVMKRALATAESEQATLSALSNGDLARVHERFGRRLNDGFGFEFVYITDAKGNVIYSSENGKEGSVAAFAWIRPAVERAMAEGREAMRSGFVASGGGVSGLMVARPFEEKESKLNVAQPLLAVTVDVVDPDFLKELGEPASLENVQLHPGESGSGDPRTVFVPNLYDGSEARLVWRSMGAGRGMVRELLPVATIFIGLLAAIFLALMIRAQRMAKELADSEARVREMAHQDFLTGLANRGCFLEELEAALAQRREGETLALLFIDLDGFKEINDSAGHAAGDKLLCEVAVRLRAALGDNGIVARFGGDEFVMLTKCREPGDVDALGARIFKALEPPVQAEGEAVSISASMGAACAPQDATSGSELLRFADIALYRAKAGGRGVLRRFEAKFEREQVQRRQITVDLTAALERGELSLLYQPVVDLETGRIVGFEALARWDHPTRGRLPPSDFVPAAEESQLIAAIDLHVLRRACVEARALGHTTLAVNMSPVTLRSTGVIRRILETMRETGFDPRRLEIEITESAVLLPSPEVQTGLDDLRDTGVRLALDDFGTGYASVVHVRRFPISKIKIDKDFIFKLGQDPDAAAIVEYKVRVGRSLGIIVTAEGVETPDQLRFLRSIGMQEAQGYLFAPPLPLAAAVAMLEREAEGGPLLVPTAPGDVVSPLRPGVR